VVVIPGSVEVVTPEVLPEYLPVTGGDNSIVISLNKYTLAIDIMLVGALLAVLGFAWKLVVAMEK
jgi:hypothetical protein